MADAKIITYGEPFSATTDVIPDNQSVALDIESVDGKDYVQLETTNNAEAIVLHQKTRIDTDPDGGTASIYADDLIIRNDDHSAGITILGPGANAAQVAFGDKDGTMQATVGFENSSLNLAYRTYGAGADMSFKAGNDQLSLFLEGGTGAPAKIATGGETTPLCSAGGIHILTGTQTGQTASSDADDMVIESSAAEQGISFLGAANTRQRIQFGDPQNSGQAAITFDHDGNDMSFMSSGGQKQFHFLEEGYLQVNTNTPTAMFAVKGNLNTNLSDSSNTCSGTGNRDVESTAHGVIKGAAVKDAAGNAYTVASVTDANNFVIDSDAAGSGDQGQWTTDPSFLKILTGDGEAALEFTNKRQLNIVDALENVRICDETGADEITTAYRNVMIGEQVAQDMTTGHANVLIGYRSGRKVTTGNHNIAMGFEAGGGDAAGDNVCLGYNTLDDDYNGQLQNTAVGIQSLEACRNHNNTAIGWRAGQSLTTGADCIFIGSQSNTSDATSNGQIAIGKNASCDAASKAVLGDGSNPVTLDFSGSGNSWSTTSDERIKENIQDSSLGLDFINALRPITHTAKNPADWPDAIRPPNFSERTDVARDADGNEVTVTVPADERPPENPNQKNGLIAQEVKAVMDSQGVEFSGWTEQANGLQRIQYERLVLPLIKAVQELTARIEELENGN